MSSNTTCSLCHWSGPDDDLIPNYVSARACPKCKMSTGIEAAAQTAPPPSILDIAIAGSTALDPAGNRRTAEQLKVPSFEEREAERKRVAERIASMGRMA